MTSLHESSESKGRDEAHPPSALDIVPYKSIKFKYWWKALHLKWKFVCPCDKVPAEVFVRVLEISSLESANKAVSKIQVPDVAFQ